MESGQLDQRVKFLQYTDTKTENGEVKEAPVFLFKCWAHKKEHTLNETKVQTAQGTDETMLKSVEIFEVRKEVYSRLKDGEVYFLESKSGLYRVIKYAFSYDKLLVECRYIQ